MGINEYLYEMAQTQLWTLKLELSRSLMEIGEISEEEYVEFVKHLANQILEDVDEE